MAAVAQTSPRPRPSRAWLDPDHSEPPGMHYRTFKSRLAGGEVSYLIHLPPDYETTPSRRYPVMYWLHGYSANPRAGSMFVTTLDDAIRRGKAPAMIVVMVNGLTATYYRDSVDGKWPVESVIMKELIPHIDQTYRTMATRETRAVEGFSMGGYGAAHLGFKYPDIFGIVVIGSGAFSDSAGLGPQHKAENGGKSVMSLAPKAYFEENDVATLIRRNADAIRGRTLVRITVGNEDGLFRNNQAVHELLTQLKIEHEYEIIPGVGHDSGKIYRILGDRRYALYLRAFK
jgi:endo-1,4-beta-xylanase